MRQPAPLIAPLASPTFPQLLRSRLSVSAVMARILIIELTIHASFIETVTDLVVATIISDGLATVSNTLFGSSCSTINGPIPPSGPTPSPGGVTSPRITPSSSVSSTASASSGTAAAAQATGNDSEKKFPLGPVIGGVVGGVILIAGLAWLAWHLL